MKALAKNPADRQPTCGQMAGELERVKRELEIEAAQAIEDSDRRLQALGPSADQRRGLVNALGLVPAPADLDATRLALLDRRASLTEPYRVRAAAELLAAIADVEKASLEEIERWQRARQALDEGSRAAAAGQKRDAIARFEMALQIEPASRRASAEADVCRRTLAEQRAIDDRTAALLAEARKAAASKQWQAAMALCSEALALDSHAEEASALQRKAADALEAEAQERRTGCERALARAETSLRKKRFDDATLELTRARELDADTAGLRALEDRLRVAMAQSARETQSAQEAADAIAAARRAFSEGHRDRALADLRSFGARVPEAVVTVEIGRLESEAKRIAAAEQRAAEAGQHATAAEAALAAGDAERAQDRAARALAIAPAHALARSVAGLAAAELRRRADAKARAATAARHLDEAQQHTARGKFEKARALVSAAADLDPANSHHTLVLTRIQEEEARAAADAERERLAKQREKAVAPILERARAAESDGDYVRAAWTAENALAIDLDCAEAKDILRRATAQLAAQPALADKTVDLTGGTGESGDPDDTVSLTRPTGMWGRVTSAVRSWIHRDEGGAREKPAVSASKRDDTLAR
jgi:hypothetical protein